jgi:CheY-like chemotaxis protein
MPMPEDSLRHRSLLLALAGAREQELLRRFAHLGMAVASAPTLDDALMALDTAPPAVLAILLDARPTEASRLLVAARAMAAGNRRVPTLALTAWSDPEVAREALACGFDAVALLPASDDELASALAAALS